MSIPNFYSPYNTEKRRCNEEAAIDAVCQQNKGLNGYQAPPSFPLNYNQMDLILFPEGSLKDSNGVVIPQQHLMGKSVALYFADSGSARCTSFLPFLLQFYRTVNESGSHQKIEVIFVSLDENQAAFEAHRSHMPWLHIDLQDPLTQVLKRHFRVVKEHEIPLYGTGPRCGVPCVVVIGSDGRDAQFLHVSSGREEGERALLRWDWRNTKFSVGMPGKKQEIHEATH